MNLLETQLKLEKSLRIVKLINELEARLENIRNWIKAHGKKFYQIWLEYRNMTISIKNRIKSLRVAYISLNS